MNVIVWMGLCRFYVVVFIKSPGGNPRDSLFTDFTAKNIHFKIRKIENLVFLYFS